MRNINIGGGVRHTSDKEELCFKVDGELETHNEFIDSSNSDEKEFQMKMAQHEGKEGNQDVDDSPKWMIGGSWLNSNGGLLARSACGTCRSWRCSSCGGITPSLLSLLLLLAIVGGGGEGVGS
ncbi:hypothetical protein Ancab_025180 [Ancistrocladus abbreviatus]